MKKGEGVGGGARPTQSRERVIETRPTNNMMGRIENQMANLVDGFYADDTLGRVNRNAKIDTDLANISNMNK